MGLPVRLVRTLRSLLHPLDVEVLRWRKTYEAGVLRGATRTLSQVCFLESELSLAPLNEGQALYRELIDLVVDAGLRLVDLAPEFRDPASGRVPQANAIFLREDPSPRLTS